MYGMSRENAITIEDESMERLGLRDFTRAIDYLHEWYDKGVNLYLTINGERLYACDEYTYDEYYLLATGFTRGQNEYLESLRNEERIKKLDPARQERLIRPLENSFRKDNELKREELRQGKKAKAK